MTDKTTHGGARKNAGRKKSTTAPAKNQHAIRCTEEGWAWLQSQAKAAGVTSVGKWADARSKGN